MPAATFDSVTQPVPNNVPSLDLKSFTEGTESQRKQFTDLLLQSLLSTGFVKLRNHDVPDQVVEDSFNWVCEIVLKLTDNAKDSQGINAFHPLELE